MSMEQHPEELSRERALEAREDMYWAIRDQLPDIRRRIVTAYIDYESTLAFVELAEAHEDYAAAMRFYGALVSAIATARSMDGLAELSVKVPETTVTGRPAHIESILTSPDDQTISTDNLVERNSILPELKIVTYTEDDTATVEVAGSNRIQALKDSLSNQAE